MFRTIQWTSGTRLSCVGCAAAQVILCVDPDLLAERSCPESDLLSPDTEDGVFVWNTMPAELVDSLQVKNNCGGAYFWRYTFNYDDAYIKTGSNLSSSDITNVVCQGCLSQYAEDLAGNEIVLESVEATDDEPAHLKLTSQHGCEYTFFPGTQEPTQCILEEDIVTGDEEDVTSVATHEILAQTTPITIENPSAVYTANVRREIIINIFANTLSPGYNGEFHLYHWPDGVKSLIQIFPYTQAGNIAFEGYIQFVSSSVVQLTAGQSLDESISVEVDTAASGSGTDTVTVYSSTQYMGNTCVTS